MSAISSRAAPGSGRFTTGVGAGARRCRRCTPTRSPRAPPPPMRSGDRPQRDADAVRSSVAPGQPTGGSARILRITRRARLPRMRLLVARCSVTYEGRLGASLAPGVRLVLLEGRRLRRDPLRRQGLQAAQLDEPTVHDRRTRRHDRRDQSQRRDARDHAARGAARHERRARRRSRTPEGRRGGRAPAAARGAVAALRDDFVLVRREFPTDIGPIDLLCRDGDGRAVVVEVKRVGEIAGVDQLLRYQERLDRDPQYAPTVGHARRAADQAPGTRLRARARASRA